MKKISIMLAALIFITSTSEFFGSEIVLVEDGRAVCAVVTGKDDGLSKTYSYHRSGTLLVPDSNALHRAAEDLAQYLNDTGWIGDPRFAVKVVEEARGARTPYRVLLGTAAIEEYGLEDEASGLSYPGYIYRTEGRDLLIFGRTSKGTANGVYGFLQDELGVRWFGPQELFTVLPERRERISVEGLDRRVEPSFTGHFGVEPLDEMPVSKWRRRMRLAEVGDSHVTRTLEPFGNPSHNVHNIIPFNRHFASNPEYFRMSGGARRPHSNPRHTNLCWSNTDVIEKATEAAVRRFAGGEDYHMFSLGITDADAYCECPDCEALQPERYYRGRSASLQRVASDQYFHFVNEVARRVKEEFPGRYLGVIAYNDVTAPPLGDIEDNVFVCLVLDISEHYDERVREEDFGLIRAWEEKGVELGMYYYTGLAKLVPSYFPGYLSEVLKRIHVKGFRGLRSEAYPGWPWTGPMVYADARLWWDVGLDIDELLEEYFEKLYGPAAPYMGELFALFEEIHMRPRGGGFLYEHYNFQQFRQYTGGDLERMKKLIASAHGAIEEFGTDRLGRSNLEERRLAYTTNGLRLFLDMLEGVVLARELDEEEIIVDDVGALSALTKIERLNELAARHERVYREAITADRYQSVRYARDTCTPVRVQWKRRISRAAGEALIDIYKHLRSGRFAPEPPVKNAAKNAADRFCALGASNEAMFKLGTGVWRLEGPNLIMNPEFEKAGGAHPDYHAHLGWKPSGADMWSYWQRGGVSTGEFTSSDKTRRSGNRAGRAHGVGDGVFIGLGPDVRPGEYYYFEAYIKNLGEPEDGTEVRVSLDWLDGGKKWMRKRTLLQPEGFGDWVRTDAVVRAPIGAETAVVLFSIRNLSGGRSVYIDDVLLKRIPDALTEELCGRDAQY